MSKEISVFFPAYNEEGNIYSTVLKARSVLEKLGLQYELLVINDGSKDNTKQVADSLAKKYPEVVVINQENGGYGTALRSGFKTSHYDLLVYTDGDGQFDFGEITKLLEKID